MSELRSRIAALTPEQRRRLEQRLREANPVESRDATHPPAAERRLSFGQERLWNLSQRMGPSSVYNIQTSYRIRGPLDVDRLEAAFTDVLARHGALRTTFSPGTGRPRTEPAGSFALEVEQTADLDAALAKAREWIARPLDPAKGPLFAARLWRPATEDHILSIRVHHMVCDGWSLSLIEDQLASAYLGEESEDPEFDYKDFVEWERDREASLRARVGAWSSVVEGAESLRLPGGRGDGGSIRFDLGAELSAEVDALALRLRATTFRVLLAGFAVALNRHTGQEDLIVCTPVMGRPEPRFERIVGYFNDVVPIRARLEGDPTVVELTEGLQDGWLASIQDPVPFQWIAAEAGTTALTRALFALGVGSEDLKLGELEVEPAQVSSLASDFGLDWFMERVGGRYRAVVRHRAESEAPIAALIDTFIEVTRLMVGDPSLRLSEFPDRSSGAASPAPVGAGGQPTSPLEARLKNIWEGVFQTPISVEDDFFDLGGHSLLAAQLIADVEAELGMADLPLSTLFEAPTVARLARLLADGAPEQRWESLVPIKPSGERPPLYFVHAHGGNVIGYSPLGRHLSERQPLYGLQAPRGDLGVRRIEDIAASYVAEVKSLQPEGPYLVGGWCLGGDVAFEMGRQLREAGDEVALVVMIDNARPEYHAAGTTRTIRNRIVTRLEMEWANLAEAPERASYLVDRIGLLLSQVMVATERLLTNRDDELPFGLNHSKAFRQAQVAEIHDKAYEGYQPADYHGDVAVFRAELQPRGSLADPALGWSPHVAGRLHTYQLPGHRLGMLQEPRIGRSAAIIEEAIAVALGGDAPA